MIARMIAPDGSHVLTAVVGRHTRDDLKYLMRGRRFRVDYIDNGNLYVSDSISRTNGYMIAGAVAVRFRDGSVGVLSQIDIERLFKPAGVFCNYEEDHDNG